VNLISVSGRGQHQETTREIERNPIYQSKNTQPTMSAILRLAPCDDLMEMIGKSVVERRKELKRIAREQQATLSYWISHSSDEFVVNWVKRHNFKGRSFGKIMFDRTYLINHTLPERHRLLDEIDGTDRADDREIRLWYIVRNGNWDIRQTNVPDPYRNL